MNLFSVCPKCSVFDWAAEPYDGKRPWGDFDRCTECGSVMDVWTESGVRNEESRIALRKFQQKAK